MIKEVVKDVLKAGKESYAARKRGKEPCIGITYKIPVLDFGYWPWTIEATLFLTEDAGLRAAVKERFFSLSDDEQHKLTFSPKSHCGEWVLRAKLWRQLLSPLPKDQYYKAMSIILNWYVHCVRDLSKESLEVKHE